MIRQLTRVSLLCLLALLLLGCFHLRRPKPLPPVLHRLHVESSAPYSDLTIQLKQLLENMHIQLVADPRDAKITLALMHESFHSITVSESSNAKTKQYRLEFNIDYQLQDEKANLIYGPKNIHTSRIYTVQEDQVLSSSNETDMLHQEMQQDAVYQIITELSSPLVAQAISHYENNSRKINKPTQ